ncbi:hypothetical protein AK812_SmicGene19462 [Symbiodinium microadriaticum]|uniref:Uncharacterized protein n=1 Tax=Symbiodinium microadriaticum TaxID=2951 RepID=A0A1Q9DSI2_SYMMI|nr:hypothetical protein AK812_SmicGene19462 [Symbiodinium microadriaticum]
MMTIVLLVTDKVLMLASRFGVDAHTCEAASQAMLAFVWSAGEETDMLSVSSPSETDPQLCELSLSSDEEPEATNSNDEPVDVPSAGGLVDIPMLVSFNAGEVHPLPVFSTCGRYIVRTELTYLLGLPKCLSVAFLGQLGWCVRAVRVTVTRPKNSARLRPSWQ